MRVIYSQPSKFGPWVIQLSENIVLSNKEYARRAKTHNSAQAVAMDGAVKMLPNFDMVSSEEKKINDQRFKHKEGCEWQLKYTKTEFQAFHRSKPVWDHIID